jgi:hypothetical protein
MIYRCRGSTAKAAPVSVSRAAARSGAEEPTVFRHGCLARGGGQMVVRRPLFITGRYARECRRIDKIAERAGLTKGVEGTWRPSAAKAA